MLPEQTSFLSELYRQYAKQLFIYAFAKIGDESRAQDIVQDTFHTAVLRIDTVINHENPGGWLMKVLKNKISESERSRRRYILRFISLDTDAPEFVATQKSPEYFQETETEILVKIKSVLTEDEFNFLMCFVFDGTSHLDMSKKLGISVYASQKRLQRIRKKLQKELPEYKKKKQ